jgi:hypothetical protein
LGGGGGGGTLRIMSQTGLANKYFLLISINFLLSNYCLLLCIKSTLKQEALGPIKIGLARQCCPFCKVQSDLGPLDKGGGGMGPPGRGLMLIAIRTTDRRRWGEMVYSGRTMYSAFVSKLNKLSEEYLSPQETQKAAVFFIGKILGSRLI